ncbi:MAG: hypothetical protein ACTSPY_00050 [Candidatus Helarchaeota archaeon]
MKTKKVILLILFIILGSFVFIGLNINNTYINPLKIDVNQTIYQRVTNSNTVQWLQNPNFSTSPIEPTWFWNYTGDNSDVVALESSGQADMKVIGEKRDRLVIANPPSTSDWANVTNPDFPVLPMGDDGPGGNVGVGIDSYGCWASHTWDENGPSGEIGQTPSVHWKQNITMPVNMSDYTITSASVSAVVNATVKQDVDCPGDTASGGSNGNVAGAVYDYVRFYVLISDLDEVREYEVAYNKTTYLGAGDSVGSDSTMGDTYLNTVPEEDLIFYLTSVLEHDHYNFTITLGIFIYCEDDDVGYELDTWTKLRIKYFNLTFTYEKKINRGTTIAWSQIGNKIPDPPANGSIVVDEAKLFFKYKINHDWTSNSPNSELRILINNKQHVETIKLSNANTSFQVAKSGGFDVTSLISTSENITPSILIYLADNFVLDGNVSISIDEVYLWITYTTYAPDLIPNPGFNWWLIIVPLIIGLVTLASIFAAYQLYFKIPRIIRIIRKLKSNIRKGKKSGSFDLNKKSKIINKILKSQIHPLNIEFKKLKEDVGTSKKG